MFGGPSLLFVRLSRRCVLSAAAALSIATATMLSAPAAAYAAADGMGNSGDIGDIAAADDTGTLAVLPKFSSAGPAVVLSQATAAHEVRVARQHKAHRRNLFYYGQCTWWVAQKRYVPWHGNAWAWWWNARRYHFKEGRKPRPGSIMVMGRSWSTPYGHVAYVLRVYHDGSFLISEMNWWGVRGGGWNRVDHRHIKSMRGVLGFIY